MKWNAPNPPGTGMIEDRLPAIIRKRASVKFRLWMASTAEASSGLTESGDIP